MKKLYKIILFITLALFISCDKLNTSKDIEAKIKECKKDNKEAYEETIHLLAQQKRQAVYVWQVNQIESLEKSSKKSRDRGIKYCEIFIKN